MQVGGRNRVMFWTGTAIPYKPGKNDLLEATRRVAAAIDSGGVVAVAGEGRIHPGEADLLPLSEGAAYFAIRSGVPLVPIAINGTSWLRFGGRVRVTVGEPFAVSGRPTRQAIDDYLRQVTKKPGEFLFSGRRGPARTMTTRQYSRLVSRWIASIGLDATLFGTHSLRRTKATLIYRRTGNLRAVQLLLGHTKIESTVRYLGIEVDDALAIAEQVYV